jgi:hypothetical protein
MRKKLKTMREDLRDQSLIMLSMKERYYVNKMEWMQDVLPFSHQGE